MIQLVLVRAHPWAWDRRKIWLIGVKWTGRSKNFTINASRWGRAIWKLIRVFGVIRRIKLTRIIHAVIIPPKINEGFCWGSGFFLGERGCWNTGNNYCQKNELFLHNEEIEDDAYSRRFSADPCLHKGITGRLCAVVFRKALLQSTAIVC